MRDPKSKKVTQAQAATGSQKSDEATEILAEVVSSKKKKTN